MALKLREAKRLPKEDKAIFLGGDNLLGTELGEQIENWSDFMRCRLGYPHDRKPRSKSEHRVFSLAMFERFDELKKIREYFKHTKPFEVVVGDKE